MKQVQNIIFDLGGIFLNIDYLKTEQAFIDLGVANFRELYSQHFASVLFEDLETGKISPTVFYGKFRQLSSTNLSDEDIQHAWNAMLLDFPIERLQWLNTIKSKYKIYLFSNTNQIHYDCFIEIVNQLMGGKQNFNDYFIKAYYSHLLGLRKPYKESFTAILEEQNLVAAETLFIDDTLKNIEGAQLAGLQTIHLVPPAQVTALGL